MVLGPTVGKQFTSIYLIVGQIYPRKCATLPNDKTIGDHVQFTKRTYRPYVEPVDLVNSDEFRSTVLEALAADEAADEEDDARADDS